MLPFIRIKAATASFFSFTGLGRVFLLAFLPATAIWLLLINSDKTGTSAPAPVKTAIPPAAAPASPQASDVLYIYYLENTPDQLQRLVNGSRGNEKIVLQFRRQTDGVLGLTAWPGQKRNAKFSLGDEVYLKRGPASGITMANEEVHLGNLELGPASVDKLRTIAASNSPGNKYLVFIPKILRKSDERINHVVYTIQNAASPDQVSFLSSPMQMRMEANPSPPRRTDFN